MKPGEIIKALDPWRRRVTRPAWTPVVEEADGPPTASKFFGTPWTGPRSPWPRCTGCKIPLAPLLQLRLGDIPGPRGRFGPGLLQFFYCSRASGCKAGYSHKPFSDQATRVRVVRPTPRGRTVPTPQDYEPPEAPAQRVVGWDRIDDRPHLFEFDENGLSYELDSAARTERVRCPEVGLDVTIPEKFNWIDDASRPAPGDKLGGWPNWIQRQEYPSCPRCGRRMALLFQVASHDHARSTLGDFGTGHVTQCPDHRDVVAFGSAR